MGWRPPLSLVCQSGVIVGSSSSSSSAVPHDSESEFSPLVVGCEPAGIVMGHSG